MGKCNQELLAERARNIPLYLHAYAFHLNMRYERVLPGAEGLPTPQYDAQNYLQDLLKLVQADVEGIPVISGMLHPDRWLLWMGLAFIICVYYFPWGIVGKLRMRALGIK